MPLKFTILTLAILGIFSCNSSKNMLPDDTDSPMTEDSTDTSNQLTYLALGDSYTIGEGVSDAGRYPSQLVTTLNTETEKSWASPKVIARTGWTVDELDKGIDRADIEGNTYDLVTLSIGVNNQYRGLPIAKFEEEFENMLLRAIGFAGVNNNHIVVLSIPDWGVTPFATQSGRDKSKIADEINAYNRIKADICKKHDVTYIDITAQYRSLGAQPDMLAADGLHPSAKMYGLWTDKLFEQVKMIY
ncbi:SGNH/GDSL hydrolase family protein [Algoriphagus sp. D3-2-R+10]|uniref:SGNH/GDSL hydrolase family protein n=1 Tax=Algoriphagus aurantiacus TaxID=3103948 RepID=UPI002B3836B5|nr:SGNH/GDSL hydrolase family protein [Algoriphagus sp. D3-2-R+10]MEB2778378.1 SGNH/GDSL hydrolase family protein [Algoriphagus sp. D3-2-R+10]